MKVRMQAAAMQTNQKSVTVEVNGQQEQRIKRLVDTDPFGRSAEEIIRRGVLDFAPQPRLTRE